MSSNNATLSRLFILVLLLLFCIALAGTAGAAAALPRYAEQEFGPANPGLSASQKLFYTFRLYWNRGLLLVPADGQGVPRDFQIDLGEPVDSIANRMEDTGLTRDADALKLFLVYSGLDITIQAGKYRLSPAMNVVELAHALQDATPQEVDFVILPGWRLEEVAAALPTSGLKISPDEFMEAARQTGVWQNQFNLPLENGVEGFLLPGTYRFLRTVTVNEMLTRIVAEFDQQISAELRSAFERQGLDVYGAVILASMVQREAVIEEEQPLIASVFLNRLAAGMKLDSDPTVQYARGYVDQQKTWWVNPLTIEHLQIDSPYNTYIYSGLTPGPICSPAFSALKAVAYPAETPYYYFRARCDGSGRHEFAVSYEEHIQNACPQ